VGCSSANPNTVAPEAATLIGVDPSDFMAEGACGTQVQVYVATLRDLTGSDKIYDAGVSAAPFVVASSPPTPCDRSLVFGNYVVVSHAYEIDLAGYDRSDIVPDHGSSAMILADGQYVAPRWTASCLGWTDSDGGAKPGISYANVTVTLSVCTQLGQSVR
jgi:hypothetical protein